MTTPAGRSPARRSVRRPPRSTRPRPSRSRPRSRRRLQLAGSAFRLRSSLFVLVFVLTMFAGRLVQIQGIEAHAYGELASEYDGSLPVPLSAPRGDILDRFGIALAETVDARMLTADPTMTAAQAPEIAAVISSRLGLSYFDLLAILRRTDTEFVYLARQVLPRDAAAVVRVLDRRNLTGVFVDADPLRTYPARDVGSNLVGFVGIDGAGLAGVEYALETVLAGTDGRATYVTDANGTRIPLADSSVEEPVPGTDVQLTIDRDLQWFAQRRLRQAVEDTGSISGAAVVLDTRTFEVLALADYPSFDPNSVATAEDGDRGSRALQDVYEPGSVEKVLTAAALIDAGKVTARTKISVPPLLSRPGGQSIKDWFPHGRLRLTLAGVLAQSSNIGTVLATERIKPGRLYRYLRGFGFGEPTGLRLRGESQGLLPDPASWLPITRDTVAFGQGLSVNAVQMAAAVATIANAGVRVDPSLVRGYIGEDGIVTPADPPERHRVVSARAARQVTSMMEMVTAPDGTAPSAAIPGYRVAGKTGTAQRVDPVSGGYAGGGFTLSFAGFAPADDPRFLTYVVLQKPSSGDGGGSAGGPVFNDIMSYALQKYAVPPTGRTAPELPLTW
ncbi:MAG TPA: penicillin-binding protein 2 [Nocardioidaceae bacterium]|nr:penicillin-binding protein 2 [Actinomycetota bacterium]HEV8055589.1 penicillin-binding protein 2 [Nocardioidaceae bacterium]